MQENPGETNSDKAWNGLYSVPLPPAPTTPPDLSAAAELSKNFTKTHREMINKALENHPYVLVTGLSGVGKTTFLSKKLARSDDRLYTGMDQIKAWASNKSTSGRKLLLIDEASREFRRWRWSKRIIQIKQLRKKITTTRNPPSEIWYDLQNALLLAMKI